MLFNFDDGQRSFLTMARKNGATKKEQHNRILNERLSVIASARTLVLREG